jgi:hypothetical protein
MAAILRWQIDGQNYSKRIDEQTEIIVGNANQPVANNLIRLRGTSVSPVFRTHASIRYDANIGGYTIEDLNGAGRNFKTYVRRINRDLTYENPLELLHHRPYPLNVRDRIEIGNTIIVLEDYEPAQTRNPSGGFNKFIGWLIVIVLIVAGINAFSESE